MDSRSITVGQSLVAGSQTGTRARVHDGRRLRYAAPPYAPIPRRHPPHEAGHRPRGLPPPDEPRRLPGRRRQDRRHGAQGQHLLALLLSRVVDDAVAARRRHPRDEEGRLRPEPDPRVPQPHRRHRRAPRRAREQADRRGRGARPAQRAPLRGRGVDRRPRRRRRPDEEVPLPQRRLPEGLLDPEALHRREHHPPADGEDAHLHDDDRRDEERVRRAAQRAPALDPPGHPRDARRSPDDPEEDPPRRLRGDGRHVRRRRPGAALHDPATRRTCILASRRSGRDRRGRREAHGHRSR